MLFVYISKENHDHKTEWCLSNKKDVDQQLFVTAESSLKRLVRVVEKHAVFCSGHFNVHRNTQKGHVAVFRVCLHQ
jgi:hypothetical protein